MAEKYYVIEKFGEYERSLSYITEAMPIKRRAVDIYRGKKQIQRAKDVYAEIEALKDAVSDKFFKERGWTTDEQGRVKEKGYPVYKAGYVTAIKKILDEI